MGLPNVNINVVGAINRPALNKEGVTGFVLYNDNIADLTSFSASNRIIKFTNISAIEATGLTADSTNFKDEYSNLSEFFIFGGTEVWVGIFDVPGGAYDFTELDLMRKASSGDIRIYTIPTNAKVLASVDVLTIEVLIAGFEALKHPAIALYSGDTGTLELGNLEDLRGLASSAFHTSVINGQDLENFGLTVVSYSSPAIGAIAGTLSSSSVEENILNVGKYNYAVGARLNQVALMLNDGVDDNVLTPIADIDEGDLDELNDKGYIFFRYLPNLAGTYLSNDNNSAAITNTFNSIHITRVRNKVVRELDRALSVLIGAPVLFNADGTMRDASASVYENAASEVLQIMLNEAEISAYDVFVDTTLDVLTSKEVTLNVTIVPVESSDNIIINIAFAQSL